MAVTVEYGSRKLVVEPVSRQPRSPSRIEKRCNYLETTARLAESLPIEPTSRTSVVES